MSSLVRPFSQFTPYEAVKCGCGAISIGMGLVVTYTLIKACVVYDLKKGSHPHSLAIRVSYAVSIILISTTTPLGVKAFSFVYENLNKLGHLHHIVGIAGIILALPAVLRFFYDREIVPGMIFAGLSIGIAPITLEYVKKGIESYFYKA